jgi:hypothetical protein
VHTMEPRIAKLTSVVSPLQFERYPTMSASPSLVPSRLQSCRHPTLRSLEWSYGTTFELATVVQVALTETDLSCGRWRPPDKRRGGPAQAAPFECSCRITRRTQTLAEIPPPGKRLACAMSGSALDGLGIVLRRHTIGRTHRAPCPHRQRAGAWIVSFANRPRREWLGQAFGH